MQVEFEGDGTNRTFIANQAVDIPHNKEGVCGVLRGLMRTVMPLQDLNLTDSQWEDIFPESQVSLLAVLAH